MKTLSTPLKLTAFTCACSYLVVCIVYGWIPSPVSEDGLLFMPGSQPDPSAMTLESVETCNNCHAGFDEPTNPYHAWQGSMMAQPPTFASAVTHLQDGLAGAAILQTSRYSPHKTRKELAVHLAIAWSIL